MDLMDDLRAEVKKRRIEDAADLQPVLSEKLMGLLRDDSSNELRENPDGITVILFVGVNGVGKTTTIGKLAHRYKQEGKKVLLAAGDTFRAGRSSSWRYGESGLALKSLNSSQAQTRQPSCLMRFKLPSSGRRMSCSAIRRDAFRTKRT
ncbi:signal recognition particle-docking protein FtsY [Actinobacillus pleuropneumoniae]|nr:signal recognition particle-docking protein FtsY [Actinobacillus pleuropneumoniae]